MPQTNLPPAMSENNKRSPDKLKLKIQEHGLSEAIILLKM